VVGFRRSSRRIHADPKPRILQSPGSLSACPGPTLLADLFLSFWAMILAFLWRCSPPSAFLRLSAACPPQLPGWSDRAGSITLRLAGSAYHHGDGETMCHRAKRTGQRQNSTTGAGWFRTTAPAGRLLASRGRDDGPGQPNHSPCVGHSPPTGRMDRTVCLRSPVHQPPLSPSSNHPKLDSFYSSSPYSPLSSSCSPPDPIFRPFSTQR